MNKYLIAALFIASAAEAGVFSEKYKNFDICAKAAHSQFDSIDMRVKGRADIVTLCRGTEAKGPIDCAKAANGISPALSSGQVAQLCSGAANLQPINCMKEATKAMDRTDSLVRSAEEALLLCARAKDSRSLDCMRELAKPLLEGQLDSAFSSRSEVVSLCSAENNR